MKFNLAFLLCLFLHTVFGLYSLAQQIPYNLVPDWQSVAGGKYATGLGVADMNNDGWKDMVVANGNDMGRQHLEIYYNNGDGTFPTSPDWESYDVDYHTHLAIGDLNSDGYNDVVVSVFLGVSGFGAPGRLKIYYNQNGELDTVPGFQSDSFYTFSCALGDADSDGDLDIAVACSEMYNNIVDHVRIFYNNNGIFQQTPEWVSADVYGGMDVEFADMNNNGYLDLLVGCQETENVVFYADNAAMISTIAGWKSADTVVNTNSIDVGNFNQDSYMDLIITNNDQLGGDGRIRAYTFYNTMSDSTYADWLSGSFNYASGILLYDVNNDGIEDLLHGGWWKPLRIHLGNGTYFDSIPVYTSTSTSVVEAIIAADLGKEAVLQGTDTFIIQQNTSLLYLKPKVIEGIISITINGTTITNGFCNVPGKNWISFDADLMVNDTAIVVYTYSPCCDIIISNWDTSRGNFIFYNNDNSGIVELYTDRVSIYPVPAGDYLIVKTPENKIYNYKLFDIQGRPLQSGIGMLKSELDLKNIKSGVYILEISGDGFCYSKKIILK